jgi:hypothetical protein
MGRIYSDGVSGCAGTILQFPGADTPHEPIMKRLEVLALYELSETLSDSQRTFSAEKGKAFNIYYAITQTRDGLLKFQKEQAAFSLSRDSASEVIREANVVLRDNFYSDDKMEKFKDDINFDQDLHSYVYYRVRQALNEFRHVFSAECRKSETYFIEQKMGFDISLLLHNAEKNLHPSVLPFVGAPAIDEIKAAGRCFALENYTACGFHTLRALEVVMADYYKQISGKTKEFRSWHDYIEAFTKLERSRTKRGSKYPSPKVAAMLDRMRQLDRNPLMHPRDSLDEMAADTLFKLGIITVTELAKDMREMAAQPELKLVDTDGEKTIAEILRDASGGS